MTGYSPAYGIERRGTTWLQTFQATYNHVASLGLWRPDDSIVIINYHGAHPSLPERLPDGSPANTTTGLAYWALQQSPITTLCTTPC